MAPDLLDLLRARTPEIRERWEALLRIERVSGPLANPDALVHLIPESLDDIFETLAKRPRVPRSLPAAKSVKLPPCDCGHNPYLAYFVAGEQALVETLILLQAALPAALRSEADVAEVIVIMRRFAGSEIDAFCGICAHRTHAHHCRHAAAGH